MNQQLLSSQVNDSLARAQLSSMHALCALSMMLFAEHQDLDILRIAAEAVPSLGCCRTLASYHSVDGEFLPYPPLPARPDLDTQIRAQDGAGKVDLSDGQWGWAFTLSSVTGARGSLLVAADHEPRADEIFLLTVLAQLTGAALANAALREQSVAHAIQLTEINQHLSASVVRLESQMRVHEVLAGAAAYGGGEHGIADALAQVSGLPVAIEDPFGNLRAWSGPGLPDRYPKPSPQEREQLLHRLATANAPLRIHDRVVILVKPRAEILGTLALVDPDHRVTDENLFALSYGSTVLALELSHQRNVAEMELRLRRDLVDDLLSGTDNDSALARAEALGHDLHGQHYLVLVHSTGSAVAEAVGRAATALDLHYIPGRHAGMVVLITDRRPDPVALHHAIREHLDTTPVAIGISGRCDQPSHFAGAFADARRAINIRLRSRTPDGATAFDELGFYRLVDAAHTDGQVEEFMREWLGALLDYDRTRNTDLVHTLSQYLECGGNYDDSAAALHIHRSTLRYRLGRIREITGFDLRDVNTRFNLQAATRVWQFLSAVHLPGET
ncbi:helix-turn-helix domain-containing protein [Nocardia sp. NBC_00508]|uniref:PucR family transcriptional regulator n=1 Tax=Nocardia sp. NBC_00508 TaxID=2975992 RepID=UPI002E81C005|nr:helix-turn-helix domain-containing protein [Nocardia sp. NBC_00508]WUD64932.1 helix-turn-helix domain-containing protein [Nocardia sp. NBC_00508]